MNKDVIYIEPEDDITDIVNKIENSKEKIIALVPPKKASVFRSIVNIKLIAKAGRLAEKAVVLVTTDPSIMKLAAATRVPVTKNLQSAPAIPELNEEIVETSSTEEVANPEMADENTEDTLKAGENHDSDASSAEENSEDTEKSETTPLEGKSGFLDEEDDDEKSADAKKLKKEEKKKNEKKTGLKSSNPVVRFVQEHKKLTIFCGLGVVLLIAVSVWAFVIAPRATVTVGIRTTTTNFSESVSFVEKLADENISEGKFYLEQKKIEEKSEVEFEATGKKNVGEKASGDLVVYAYFKEAGQVPVNAGTIFSYDGEYSFISQNEVSIVWDGADVTICQNNGDASLVISGCMVSGRVAVVAEKSGAAYNIAASATGWTTVANLGVYSDKAMAGGTDKTVTIVTQEDIDNAKTKVQGANEAVNKQKLLDTVSKDDFVIESSFKQTVGEAVATPAVGEEVEEGKKAKLSVTTTDTIYVIDGTKVEEFIREKAKLADNFKIYEMNDPFVENFTKTDSGYIAKLKTSFVSGPKLTESDVAEIVKGKGVGTARQDLEKAFDGISKINIETNYPWVMSIPNDNNRITVNIEVNER